MSASQTQRGRRVPRAPKKGKARKVKAAAVKGAETRGAPLAAHSSAIRADLRNTNRAFDQFLSIGAADRRIIARYRSVLGDGAAVFAQIFYDYLFKHPPTARVLRDYQRQGGSIDALVGKQTRHLHELLDARSDLDSAEKMARIGEVHHRHAIAPVWIMGAYLRYLDHLLGIVHRDRRIRAADRGKLEDAVAKLLFRDMGLMLEGYWVASNNALAVEHAKLLELQQQITDLLANIPQLIWSVDTVENRPLYVSPVAREVCQMDVEMPIPCLGWTVPEHRHLVVQAWERALAGEQSEVETYVQMPSGGMRWFRRMFHPYRDARGRVTRVDGVMEDITETRAMTERLEAMATTDGLTGLPNRTLFHDRLERAIAAAARDPGRHVAVLLMDLDHFKDINDTLGHPAGDRVLVEVAQRLSRALREEDTITRLGGDEFAVLLASLQAPARTAETVAHKLLASLRAPVLHQDRELHVGASIGISVYPQHGGDAATLLSRADIAMYACKNRNVRHLFYDSSMDCGGGERLQLSNELRHALERGQVYLEFQPKIDLANGRVSGAEALVRWQHPKTGRIEPEGFIPLSERTGLIHSLTDWVIDQALARCREWRAGGDDLHVAVNISGRILPDPGFAERIMRALSVAGLPPSCLEIEITENILMTDIENTRRLLQKLCALGVRISIDDFGTGYSSLAYLKQLPLNALKIDKSFVRDMTNDGNGAAIVRTIVDLAHNLGHEVVAEGVEDERTLELLRQYRCDCAQGFYLARPMLGEQFRGWLAARRDATPRERLPNAPSLT
jgi:diguanylate cyclase (GGDEF)-like protein